MTVKELIQSLSQYREDLVVTNIHGNQIIDIKEMNQSWLDIDGKIRDTLRLCCEYCSPRGPGYDSQGINRRTKQV